MSSEKCQHDPESARVLMDLPRHDVELLCNVCGRIETYSISEIARAVRHYRARPKLPEGVTPERMFELLAESHQIQAAIYVAVDDDPDCKTVRDNACQETKDFMACAVWLRDNLPALLGDQP